MILSIEFYNEMLNIKIYKYILKNFFRDMGLIECESIWGCNYFE